MALYPTQYSELKRLQDNDKLSNDAKNECGRPGLNGGYFDNPHLKFGVNCYGVKDEHTDAERTLMNKNMASDVSAASPSDSSSTEMTMDSSLSPWIEKINSGEIQRNSFKCGKWSSEENNSDRDDSNKED